MNKPNNYKKMKLTNQSLATKICFVMFSIMIFTFFLQGVDALSWSNNTFNDSLSTGELVYDQEDNLTRWLEIPSTVKFITEGFLNISGFDSYGVNNSFSFYDNFSRPDAASPGNGWINASDAPSNFRIEDETLILNDSSAVTGLFIIKNFSDLDRIENITGVEFILNVTSANIDLNTHLENSSGTEAIRLEFCDDNCGANPGDIVYVNNDGVAISIIPWIAGENYKIRLDNINYETYTYDIYIDDFLNVTSAPFTSNTSTAQWEANSRSADTGIYLLNNITFVNDQKPSEVTLNIGNLGANEFSSAGNYSDKNNRTSNLNQAINNLLNSTFLIGSNYIIPFVFHSDTAGVIRYNSLLFNNAGFFQESDTFNENVSETDQQTFSINISFDSGRYSFIAADLIYNGTRQTGTKIGTGNNVIFNATFDIPLMQTTQPSETRDLKWEISLTEGSTITTFNSTTQTQNISTIFLEQCNATYTVQALNFTSSDEVDSSRIDPYYFAGDFDFWLGSGSIKKNNAFSNTSTDEIKLCISPEYKNFTIDANIEYNDVVNSSVYNTRNYFFQGDLINNQSRDIALFLLESDDSTSFILKVQDTNLLPIVDALIIIQRFDHTTGNFTNVSIAKTDDNGQTVGFFKTETVDYRFIIKKNGVVLLTTVAGKVVPETAPFTLTFTVGADEGAPWTRFEDLSNLTKSLIFNSSTGNVSFAYIDTSGEFTLGRLTLRSINLSGSSEVVCDVNSSSSSGTLICGTSNVSGTYTASAFITRGTDTFLVEQISFKIETFSDVAGLYGVFLAWFIILISAFMFKFNEIAGIVLMNLAVIMVNLIGLVNFGFLFVFGMMGVSIILIVLLKK